MAHEVNPGEKDPRFGQGLANPNSNGNECPQDTQEYGVQRAQELRTRLTEQIGKDRLDLWIPESTRWSFETETLSLWFDSEFSCQLAQQMLAGELANQLRQLVGASAQLTFSVKEDAPAEVTLEKTASQTTSESIAADTRSVESTPSKLTSQRTTPSNDLSPREVALARSSARANPHVKIQELDSTCESWNQFVGGESNQLAWATAKLVVAEPGKISPVLLHGPSGVGKSLLVKAIAEQLRIVQRLPRVVHMTSEQFLNDFTDGLRGGGLPMFRRKYRDVEALILEDIQFFIGKKSSLTEVKHTLDNLLRLGKQVIFTSDRSLNDLQLLGSELVGRIRGGLTTPVFPLDEQTRRTILKREIEADGLAIDDQVVENIANRVTGDGRVLSGIVKRLTATAAITSFVEEGSLSPSEPAQKNEPVQRCRLDWDRCWGAIADLVQASKPVVRIVDIDRAVCDMFGLEPESLQSESKIRRVSQPRMLAMFLARKYTPAAYKEIGQYFGRRRHSTVISAEKTVSNWLQENSDLDVGRGMKVRDAIRHVESQLQVG